MASTHRLIAQKSTAEDPEKIGFFGTTYGSFTPEEVNGHICAWLHDQVRGDMRFELVLMSKGLSQDTLGKIQILQGESVIKEYDSSEATLSHGSAWTTWRWMGAGQLAGLQDRGEYEVRFI